MGSIDRGLLVYFLGHSEPDYVSILRDHVENGAGLAFGLHKAGSGQVALVHGFYDDLEVCVFLKERLETDGGFYSCEPLID